MPVHVGIACKECQKIYFLATDTDRIEPDRPMAGLERYRLTCGNPCRAVRFFHAEDMCPYSVSTYSFERGYANWGEYQELRRVG